MFLAVFMVFSFHGEHTRHREEGHYRRIIGVVVFPMRELHYLIITKRVRH